MIAPPTDALTIDVEKAYSVLKDVVVRTPLQYDARLSKKYGAEIYFKREDLQAVRSYKIRGAYYNIYNLTEEQRAKGVVCASAGNHAQGFASACSQMKIKGIVFMPQVTPRQKIERVRQFGEDWVRIELVGNTYDEAAHAASLYCTEREMTYVHAFDNLNTIAGQGTVAYEILEEMPDVDMVICPVGGGGLVAGVSYYMKSKQPSIQVVGVDPQGAPKMVEALKAGYPKVLDKIDNFMDGVAVKKAGNLTFEFVRRYVDKVIASPEGKTCTVMIELYQNEGLITEPAGAVSVAALEQLQEDIAGKKVVCIISGGNNDIARYAEVIDRSMIYEGLKHYFIVEFPQKPGQLLRFLQQVLGPTDDIVRFEYLKSTNREYGPALVGIELTNKDDLTALLQRMQDLNITYKNVMQDDVLRKYLM
ncbi:threonine ammonia-lyase IlvA [Cytophagaceae bacterium YF14B1]|uniref:L-threonine dehydratase n=1 Tax=Xanthocytophaga flava TaxID=3048013 RepID=A0AAE3QK91_9BACT|nr:threonine ammonia-lyase IlvA [Xanthocytophaga flavus]MDJ1480156.1 threonine ammonia-lyase IlvA [Xanthocytophaga flavus]